MGTKFSGELERCAFVISPAGGVKRNRQREELQCDVVARQVSSDSVCLGT